MTKITRAHLSSIAAIGSLLITGPTLAQTSSAFELVPLGKYESGVFNEGAAEIVTYDARTQRVFVVNANAATVDVLSLADPANPEKIAEVDVSLYGAVANSVAVSGGVLAVAVEAQVKQDPGVVVFIDVSSLDLVDVKEVGALPDAVTFSSDGRYLLVANEGEPNDDYTVDPEGSVSVIDLSVGVEAATVATASFTAFNDQAESLRSAGVRLFGPNASVAQDLEPEFIAPAKNGLAFVALQENNALAVVDIASATVQSVIPLGYKDHSQSGNELDPSNRDDQIAMQTWPVLGMYQPDSIVSYGVDGETYLVTANEGDARDYDGFSEEARINDLDLDPVVFPNASELQEDEALGRLKTTTTLGDTDGDGDVDQLYAYGARSFSIWNANGEQVFDSGSDFESITANLLPDNFNSTDDENDSFDNRSDDKGPEPEGVVVGVVNSRQLAFIGLERVGGIMVYDVTEPTAPVFQSYVNTRNFDVDVVDAAGGSNSAAGDLSPEGLAFVSAKASPNGQPLLIVGHEVSGTTTVFAVQEVLRRGMRKAPVGDKSVAKKR